MANTCSTDRVASAIAESLKSNKTLKLLNLESNFISGQGIVNILAAINVNQVMTEFRISNQKPEVIGIRHEMAIAALLRENKSLLKFGIFLEVRCARIHVSDYLQRNNDNLRRGRVGAELIMPPVEDRPYFMQRDRAAVGLDDRKPANNAKKEDEEESGDDE
jgi:tropomodulin